ncbi:MAG: family 10 glycosylhydrolase [Lentisphaeria bacterium]|nr:family 10 glycosylhydrolase [Lentisphaeria bacterium]
MVEHVQQALVFSGSARRCLVGLVCFAAFAVSADLFDLHARRDDRPLATAITGTREHPVPLMESGIAFLRQPCRFVNGATRAGWDLPVRLDLRRGRGIRLNVRCDNPVPVSYFACYFKSGDGWYRSEFSIKGTGRWETVELLKSDTGVEGTPAGWRRIEKIRVCAWASAPSNTAFDVSSPAFLDAPLDVLIARGTAVLAGESAGEIGLVTRQAKQAAALLRANGVTPSFMEDVDLTEGIPAGVKAVILPYNPSSPPAFENALAQFYIRGGGVAGFHTVPEALRSLTGIHVTGWLPAAKIDGGLEGVALVGEGLTGAPARMPQTSWNTLVLTPAAGKARVAAQWTNKRGDISACPAIVAGERAVWMSHILRNNDAGSGGKLLLAMTGHVYPGVWRAAAVRQLNGLGRDIHPAGFEAAAEWLDGVAKRKGHSEAVKRVTFARGFKDQGLRRLAEGDNGRALDYFRAAETHVREAFFLVQPSAAGEFRGVWCHRGYGVSGWTWDESARRLRAAGFTAVMPNVANASEAWYPSQRLNPPPSVDAGRDYLKECLAATRKYGLECHPWLVCFRLDDTISAESIRQLRAAGRLQQSPSGAVNQEWLCPTHPANRAQMLGVADELLRTYPVDGLHLDFIRLPGSQYCFCPQCRDAFERHTNARVEEWPKDVSPGGARAGEWINFRAGVITAFVRDVAALRARVRPAAKISAAVFADSATARRSVAQDWPAWARLGYVDFVCPMNYTPDSSHLEHVVTRQLGAAQKRIPVYPGLGLSADHFDSIELVKQIGVTRRNKTGGFMIFEFNRQEALGPFVDLGKGLTK